MRDQDYYFLIPLGLHFRPVSLYSASMFRYILSILAVLTALNAFGDDAGKISPSLARDSRFFEMRTYHAAPGKLEALHARFRDFTNALFVKHGIQIVGFWVPMNKDGQYENTLVYLLAFPNRKAHDKAWKDFTADSQWQAVKSYSEANGKLVEQVDSVFMTATDYSPIK
jgi:hypothetical protein